MKVKLIERIAIVLFAIFLMGPAFLLASHVLDMRLPSWLTAEDAAVLAGSWSDADVRGQLDVEGITTRGLQDAIEDMAGDFVPCKGMAELGYAGLQRASIELASVPFGYSVYPTFYGTSYLVDRSRDVLYSMPWHGKDHIRELELAYDALSRFADGHDDLNWVFCLTEDTGISDHNVANDLVSSRIEYSQLLELARKELPEMQVVDSRVTSEETRYEDLFRTDHHYQIQGSVKIYERIISALGRVPVSIDGFHLASDDLYYGSRARLGLCLDYSDVVFDVDYKRSDLDVRIDGEHATMAEVDKSYSDEEVERWNRFEGPYSFWFHPDYKVVEFENRSLSPSTGALLLISDSSDNSTDRLYAESYRHVYELDMRYNSVDEIGRFIESHDDICDAVVFGSPNILVECYCGDREGLLDGE